MDDAGAGAPFRARSRGPDRHSSKIGQNDLAAMPGIARENVTRILNDWQRYKVVSRLSGYYCIENKVQLESQVKL
jgi:CRP-like cAMP-binding protein